MMWASLAIAWVSGVVSGATWAHAVNEIKTYRRERAAIERAISELERELNV
jgi:hypothetical protein